jgi:hypothetical protein
MDEYREVQKLRELWSKAIMIWGQVFIPLGAAIVAFFALLAALSGFSRGDFGILIIGWAIFTISMVYWRWMANHLDEQIVELYPIFLRIEQASKWDIITRYYFNNLADRSRSHLRHELGLESWPKKYDDFVEDVKPKGLDYYGFLLSLWREYGRKSVTDRGHKIQDIVVFSIIVLFLILVLSINFGTMALLALLLFILLFYWGWHRGWECSLWRFIAR